MRYLIATLLVLTLAACDFSRDERSDDSPPTAPGPPDVVQTVISTAFSWQFTDEQPSSARVTIDRQGETVQPQARWHSSHYSLHGPNGLISERLFENQGTVNLGDQTFTFDQRFPTGDGFIRLVMFYENGDGDLISTSRERAVRYGGVS